MKAYSTFALYETEVFVSLVMKYLRFLQASSESLRPGEAEKIELPALQDQEAQKDCSVPAQKPRLANVFALQSKQKKKISTKSEPALFLRSWRKKEKRSRESK